MRAHPGANRTWQRPTGEQKRGRSACCRTAKLRRAGAAHARPRCVSRYSGRCHGRAGTACRACGPRASGRISTGCAMGSSTKRVVVVATLAASGLSGCYVVPVAPDGRPLAIYPAPAAAAPAPLARAGKSRNRPGASPGRFLVRAQRRRGPCRRCIRSASFVRCSGVSTSAASASAWVRRRDKVSASCSSLRAHSLQRGAVDLRLGQDVHHLVWRASKAWARSGRELESSSRS